VTAEASLGERGDNDWIREEQKGERGERDERGAERSRKRKGGQKGEKETLGQRRSRGKKWNERRERQKQTKGVRKWARRETNGARRHQDEATCGESESHPRGERANHHARIASFAPERMSNSGSRYRSRVLIKREGAITPDLSP